MDVAENDGRVQAVKEILNEILLVEGLIAVAS
jgi:hypothetical protein